MIRILLVLSVALASPSALACTVRVAVASNFGPALQSIIDSSSELADYEIALITGSSGKLFAQIVNGAPYDLFFSADEQKPARLWKLRLAQSAPQTYALGVLALWTPDQSARTRPIPSPLAIANQRVAPYGVAGHAWLDALSPGNRPGRQVVAENVAQAFHFAKTRNAKAALVALSQLLAESVSPDEYQTLSETELPPIVQSSVRIARDGYCKDATAVYEFIHSTKAQTQISQLGYRSVERKQ